MDFNTISGMQYAANITQKGNQDDEKLKAACQEFEAYFLKQMVDVMRKTVPENQMIEKSHGRDIFEDMLYDTYAKEMASGKGMGLAQMLYRQIQGPPKES